MIKFNYSEPEFKVVKAMTQDVLTASVPTVNSIYDTIGGGSSGEDPITSDDLGFGV
jgi:hypothetical protein